MKSATDAGKKTGMTIFRQSTAIDDFAGLMREWAEWVTNLQGLGHSDSTTLWRAQFGRGGLEFASAVPHGLDRLEAHGALRRLIDAMADLVADDDTSQPVLCVQWLYLFGPHESASMYGELTGKGRAKFYQLVQAGEMLIRREIKRH